MFTREFFGPGYFARTYFPTVVQVRTESVGARFGMRAVLSEAPIWIDSPSARIGLSAGASVLSIILDAPFAKFGSKAGLSDALIYLDSPFAKLGLRAGLSLSVVLTESVSARIGMFPSAQDTTASPAPTFNGPTSAILGKSLRSLTISPGTRTAVLTRSSYTAVIDPTVHAETVTAKFGLKASQTDVLN